MVTLPAISVTVADLAVIRVVVSDLGILHIRQWVWATTAAVALAVIRIFAVVNLKCLLG